MRDYQFGFVSLSFCQAAGPAIITGMFQHIGSYRIHFDIVLTAKQAVLLFKYTGS